MKQDVVYVGRELPKKVRERHAVYETRPVTTRENFAPGNRACVGCAEAVKRWGIM
jgi:hypothetical protein